jgi:hypothetical protein
MAKTEFLQIRVDPADLSRIRKVAAADHLDTSTWARRLILRAVEKWENENAEQPPRRPATER